MIKALLAGVSFFASAIIAYAAWGPFRIWVFAQLPIGQYHGLYKLMSICLISYFGGAAIPLVFIVLGIVFLGMDI